MGLYFKMVIHRNGAVGSQGDAYSFEIQAFGVRFATRSHQHDVGLHAFCLAFFVLKLHETPLATNAPLAHGRGDGGEALHATLHVKGDTLFLHLLAQSLGDVAVEGGQTFLEELYHGHL